MFKQFKITRDKYGLKTALYYHIPLFFTFKWRYWIEPYDAVVVAPIILYKKDCKAWLLRHEIIHFWQQAIWTLPLYGIIYGISYGYLRLIKKMSNAEAYRNSVFEKYAYSHDDEITEELYIINDIAIRLGKEVNAG